MLRWNSRPDYLPHLFLISSASKKSFLATEKTRERFLPLVEMTNSFLPNSSPRHQLGLRLLDAQHLDEKQMLRFHQHDIHGAL